MVTVKRFIGLIMSAAAGCVRWALSAPIFVKIIGIGAIVAGLFASVVLLQVRASAAYSLEQMLEQRTRSLAHSVAANLERPLSVGDRFFVAETLRRIKAMYPDISYIVVWDGEGQLVSHTFDHGVPADLIKLARQAPKEGEHFRVFATRDGRLFHMTVPILQGTAGMLQLGLSDKMVATELASVTRSFIWSVAFCSALGAILALALTHLLVQPIDRLVEAVGRIGAGQFEARAPIWWPDEIGRLAAAFNRMAESLQRYRQEVEKKEGARRALIEKIVYAQEEERKAISRELHDQLGQSLLALLLRVQALSSTGGDLSALRQDMETRIESLIEEVRRLSWGMRPSILDDYGLDSALARYVEETAEHSGLAIDYQYIGPPDRHRLPGRVEVTLYRIAQEALTNSVRHANASRVSTVVLQTSSEVTLVVEDDGRGFDAEAVQRDTQACLGLTSMRERAELLGGTCIIESRPGSGTTLRVTIPLDGE